MNSADCRPLLASNSQAALEPHVAEGEVDAADVGEIAVLLDGGVEHAGNAGILGNPEIGDAEGRGLEIDRHLDRAVGVGPGDEADLAGGELAGVKAHLGEVGDVDHRTQRHRRLAALLELALDQQVGVHAVDLGLAADAIAGGGGHEAQLAVLDGVGLDRLGAAEIGDIAVDGVVEVLRRAGGVEGDGRDQAHIELAVERFDVERQVGRFGGIGLELVDERRQRRDRRRHVAGNLDDLLAGIGARGHHQGGVGDRRCCPCRWRSRRRRRPA